MPKPAPPLLEVTCPCCEATLKVDPSTGAVITHKEKVKPPPIDDLAVAARRLKQEAVERDEKFRKSMEEQKNRQQVLAKKFDELFKEAKENPDIQPRRKEIDWD